MRLLFGLLIACSCLAYSQSTVQQKHDDKTVNLLPPRLHPKPRISLQAALKIAENYITEEHIDVSAYTLFEAKWMLYGDNSTPDSKKTPCWYFWWTNDNGALGDYVEIIVSMDGKAGRIPSM